MNVINVLRLKKYVGKLENIIIGNITQAEWKFYPLLAKYGLG